MCGESQPSCIHCRSIWGSGTEEEEDGGDERAERRTGT